MKHILSQQSFSPFISIKTLLILTLTVTSLYSFAQDNCPLFAPVVTYSSGGFSPYYITTGDFNKDRKTDMAIVNTGSANIGVLLGNGDGTFTTANTYSTGGFSPYYITTGDFNGDDKADLAVANFSSGIIGVLLGNGDGTFADATTYSSGGSGPFSLVTGDFNNDNKPDLAIGNYNDGNIGVLLGNGDGTFTTAVTYGSGGSATYDIATGDFNKDGKTDLATVNQASENIGVLLGNGDGTFTLEATTFSTGGSEPLGIKTGDFNKDGKPDLAVANYNSNNIGVLLGNGDGTFADATTYSSGGSGPYYMTTADFNGNGNADLAVVNYLSNSLSALLGNGDGTFTLAATTYNSGGSGPYYVATGDFNNDNKPDLAVANYNSSDVGVLLNTSCSVCGNATHLSTTNISAHSAKLNWTADVNPAQWQVQYEPVKRGAKWTTITVSGTARSLNINNLSAHQRYQWHLRSKCGNTWNSYCEVVYFTTPYHSSFYITQQPASVQENKAVADEGSSPAVMVSPNPATNITNVQLNGFTGKVMLQLMDVQGRVLKAISLQTANVKSTQQQFDVADVGSGTYFIVVMDEKGNKETKKVVVTH